MRKLKTLIQIKKASHKQPWEATVDGLIQLESDWTKTRNKPVDENKLETVRIMGKLAQGMVQMNGHDPRINEAQQAISQWLSFKGRRK